MTPISSFDKNIEAATYQLTVDTVKSVGAFVLVLGTAVTGMSLLYSTAAAIAAIAISTIALIGVLCTSIADSNHAQRHARELLTPNMDEKQILKIVTVIGKIPILERANFVKQALQLVKEDIDGDLRRLIVESFSEIPANEREAFLKQARQLITPGLDGLFICGVVNTLRFVKSAQRESFIKQVQGLITADMSGAQKAKIAFSLGLLYPFAHQEDLIGQASRLITEEMNGEQRSSIYIYLAGAGLRCQNPTVLGNHVVERNAIVEQALSLTKDMNAVQKTAVIVALCEAPSIERAERVNKALSALKEDRKQNPNLNIADRIIQILQTSLNAPMPQVVAENVTVQAAAG